LSDSAATQKAEQAERNDIHQGQQVQPCTAGELLAALQAGYALLESQVPVVNSLNVFPVPDGDTGTNMSLTMKAALDEAKGRDFGSASELARVIAHGALMGARGNSGVILSQLLRGFARGLDDMDDFHVQDLVRALLEAATTAYKGVMKPVEGTILTVAREAAQAANSAFEGGSGIKECLGAAFDESQRSLARTPNLLPVLAEAGVVDAGGKGFTIILEGIVRYLNGQKMQLVEQLDISTEYAHVVSGDYNYDTQFILQGPDLDVDAIRAQVAAFGDSVMVVGDQTAVKVHVHSDDPGQVLSYGISQGRISAVIIENMQQQFEEFQQASQAPEIVRPVPAPDSIMGEVGIVAVASGAGMQRVFKSLGVGAVVPGGQTMNPSTQDIIQSVDSLKQEDVVILPNNSNIILTAEQAKTISHRNVAVLPTRTIPQGIAALLAFNYQAGLEENIAAMLEAINHVQTVEITRAVRSVQVNGLKVSEGQVIGLLNDELLAAAEGISETVMDIFEHLDAQDYEIVTMYYGEDTPEEDAQQLADMIRQRYSQLDVEVLDGGQAHYYYIISVE